MIKCPHCNEIGLDQYDTNSYFCYCCGHKVVINLNTGYIYNKEGICIKEFVKT